MMSLDSNKVAAAKAIFNAFGVEYQVTSADRYAKENGFSILFMVKPEHRVGRGQYRIPQEYLDAPDSALPVSKRVSAVADAVDRISAPKSSKPAKRTAAFKPAPVVMEAASNVVPMTKSARVALAEKSLVPKSLSTYVPFGNYADVKNIIASGEFFPVFITGLSGNGKTISIEQACAALKRECIRVNITEETEEADLVGGDVLVDGNIVYREGPVITAMRRGAIVILDEVDLNATKILCLQSIMEGGSYFIKKTGETVRAEAGFNIFATANTKGRGSERGRFVGTKFMNEAFLERFAVTFEQEYPTIAVEKRILTKVFKEMGIAGEDDFIASLAMWAAAVRSSFAEGVIDEVISTRRLVAIARAYRIFDNRHKAIKLCINRFEGDIKEQLLDLYSKIDPKAVAEEVAAVSADD